MDWKDDMASSASSEESLIDLARPLADMAKRKVDVVGPSQYYRTHSRPLASSYVSVGDRFEIQLLLGRWAGELPTLGYVPTTKNMLE